MADFVRYLPFSQRVPVDETGVTSDRRAQLAGVVDEAARMLGAAPLDEGVRGRIADSFLVDAGLEAGPASTAGAIATLTAVADGLRSGRKRSIRALARAVRAVLVLGRVTGSPPDLAPATTGAVALYRVGAAPLERRAVIARHTLRATDAGWEFGRGPVLQGTAVHIVEFLLELSDIPPQPA